jgi:phosphatidylserine/phosphatidylglycerophosphate/cardiolipin synthase-like enzyme
VDGDEEEFDMKSAIRSSWAVAALAALAAFPPTALSAAVDIDSVAGRMAAVVPGLQLPDAPPAPTFDELKTREGDKTAKPRKSPENADTAKAPRAPRPPKASPVTETPEAPAARQPAPPARPPVNSGSAQFFAEPDAGRGPVLDAINGARQSITLTIYEISDPEIVSALTSAKQRGVSVQVLYNLHSFTTKNPNAATISQLQSAGIEVKAASPSFTVTHQKTLVADGQTAVIMSFNLQASYFSTSRDFGYVTTDPALVSEIEEVFNADWNYSPVSPSQPALVWSPVNSRSKITEVISGATSSLDIYNEELEDASMLAAISDAARRGVRVRVLCPVLGNTGKDGNAAGRGQINAAGGQAKIGTGLYIHAKAVLADYGTSSARAYMGSENFSGTSLDKNRELGILLTDGSMLSSLESTFQSDWGQ